MSIPIETISKVTQQILAAESRLRTSLHKSDDPFPVPLTHDLEIEARQSGLLQAKHVTILIGTGPGGTAVADDRTARGHHILAFEKTETPRGKLELVAPDKSLLREGLLAAFASLTRPLAHTYLNTAVDYAGTGEGISLAELVDLTGSKEVIFATGTKERHTILTTGEDLGKYEGHSYAYELIGEMNKWMNSGQNLADFPLSWNEAGDKVIISGAGFVGMEDTSKLILSWQILRKLKTIGIDITKQEDKFAQFKFTSLPLTKLAEIYKDAGENGQRLRNWMGHNLVLSGQDFGKVLLGRLYELGVKPTEILYRRSKQEFLKPDTSTDKEDTRLTSTKLNAFARVGGFAMLYSREPGSVQTHSNRIQTLTLIERDYSSGQPSNYTAHETVRPAYIISALGGQSSPIKIGSNILRPDEPQRIDGVTYAIAGNAVAGKGNRAASIESTRKVLAQINEYVVPTPTTNPERLIRTITYLESLAYLPANVILQTLLHTPPLLQEKWGWNKI